MLRTCVPEKHTNWKAQLPAVVYACNCTCNGTTVYSLFELVFGREPRVCLDIK